MSYKKIVSLISSALLIGFSITSCGTDQSVGLFTQDQIQSVAVNNISTNSTEIFVTGVSKLGVRLNDVQLKTISLQRHAVPSGRFASRPALKLTSEQNLDTHFKKHSREFKGVNTKEQYLQRAIDFLKNDSPTSNYYFDTTSFDKGYQSNVVKYDSKTHELSAMREDGDITTYYTSDDLSTKRFVLVPAGFSF